MGRSADPWLLGPTQVQTPNSIAIGSAIFSLQNSQPRVTILHNSPPLFLLIIDPSYEGSVYPSNTWFLGPSQILNPNGSWIGSVVFAQLTTECPYTLQWDARSSLKIVTVRHIYIHSTAKWPRSNDITVVDALSIYKTVYIVICLCCPSCVRSVW